MTSIIKNMTEVVETEEVKATMITTLPHNLYNDELIMDDYDLELQIVNRYHGESKLQRLLHILTTTTKSTNPSTSVMKLQKDAFVAAIQYCQTSCNTIGYKNLFQWYEQQNQQQQKKIIGTSNNNNNMNHDDTKILVFDSNWYHTTNQQNIYSKDVLMNRLHTAQGHLNKDSIRISYLALAELSYRTGMIMDAWYETIRAKEYCSTSTSSTGTTGGNNTTTTASTGQQQQRHASSSSTVTTLNAASGTTSTTTTATNITFQILFYSILLRNYQYVHDQIKRLESSLLLQQQQLQLQQVQAAGGSSGSRGTSGSGGITGDQTLLSYHQTVRYKLLVATGLYKLANMDYVSAAEQFRTLVLSNTTTNSSHTNTPTNTATTTIPSASSSSETTGVAIPQQQHSIHDWDSVLLAPEDVALYAAFLTFAVSSGSSTNDYDQMDQIQQQHEQQSQRRYHTHSALNLAENMEALELVPIMKEIIILFYRYGQYQKSYTLLMKHVVPILQHDLYMSCHVPILLQHIRNRAIQLYWEPYHTISFQQMIHDLGSGIICSTNYRDNNDDHHTNNKEMMSTNTNTAVPSTTTTTTTTTTATHHTFGTKDILDENNTPNLILLNKENDHNNNSGKGDVMGGGGGRRPASSPSDRHHHLVPILFKTLMNLFITDRTILGYDTRIDLLKQTITRSQRQLGNEELPKNQYEYERYQQTSMKLTTVTNQTLNQTFHMFQRLACLEHDISLTNEWQQQQPIQHQQQFQRSANMNQTTTTTMPTTIERKEKEEVEEEMIELENEDPIVPMDHDNEDDELVEEEKAEGVEEQKRTRPIIEDDDDVDDTSSLPPLDSSGMNPEDMY